MKYLRIERWGGAWIGFFRSDASGEKCNNSIDEIRMFREIDTHNHRITTISSIKNLDKITRISTYSRSIFLHDIVPSGESTHSFSIFLRICPTITLVDLSD